MNKKMHIYRTLNCFHTITVKKLHVKIFFNSTIVKYYYNLKLLLGVISQSNLISHVINFVGMIVTVYLYEAKDYSREKNIFCSQKGSKKTPKHGYEHPDIRAHCIFDYF